MNHLRFETVMRSQLEKGDTIRTVNGQLRTISSDDLRGRNMPVERVLFPKWFKGVVIKYQKQI